MSPHITQNKMEEEEKDALPPFAKSWEQLYALVIASLVITVATMYLFGKYFR
jgi:hypothetical protein